MISLKENIHKGTKKVIWQKCEENCIYYYFFLFSYYCCIFVCPLKEQHKEQDLSTGAQDIKDAHE